VGIDENDVLKSVRAYPNPAQSSSELHFNQEIDNARVTIYSMDSKIVYDEYQVNNFNSIQLPIVKPGYYFLNIQRNNEVYRVELMIWE
jgi:hypothetical protein